jgi:hypothetical protein
MSAPMLEDEDKVMTFAEAMKYLKENWEGMYYEQVWKI